MFNKECNIFIFCSMKKITISVCFIVKNEDKVFEKILKCAQKFADEIVVVIQAQLIKLLTLQENKLTKFTILNGVMIFQKQEILRSAREHVIILCGLMRMTLFLRRI